MNNFLQNSIGVFIWFLVILGIIVFFAMIAICYLYS